MSIECDEEKWMQMTDAGLEEQVRLRRALFGRKPGTPTQALIMAAYDIRVLLAILAVRRGEVPEVEL